MKVCCVIVTYNRKELLSKNLDAISKQVEYSDIDVIIVDNNSSDNTKEYVLENYKHLNIKYFYLNENLGGAGGFSYAIEVAHKNRYDWVIMMDDDGRPYNDYCFKNVFDFIIENNLDSQDKYLLNSLVLNDENTLSFGIGHYDTVSSIEEAKIVDEKGAIIDSINPFNGTYVSLGLIDAIGYPNKDFFIKGDEVDYTMRAKKAGAYVATVYNSKYFHPKVSNRKKKKIFGHEMYVYIEAPWKEYYGIRNYVYSVINNTNKKQAKKIIRRAKYKRYLSVLLTKCKKRETIKMIKMGIKDGKNGKLGATIRP